MLHRTATDATKRRDQGQTAQALRAWERLQRDEREIAGAQWQNTGLVLTTRTGGPLAYGNVWESWNAVLVRAGVTKRGLHAERHTALSRALDGGAVHRRGVGDDRRRRRIRDHARLRPPVGPGAGGDRTRNRHSGWPSTPLRMQNRMQNRLHTGGKTRPRMRNRQRHRTRESKSLNGFRLRPRMRSPHRRLLQQQILAAGPRTPARLNAAAARAWSSARASAGQSPPA